MLGLVREAGWNPLATGRATRSRRIATTRRPRGSIGVYDR